MPISAVADVPTAPVSGTPSVDTTTGVVTGSVSSTDPAGQTLTYSLATAPTDGSTVTVNADGSYDYHPSSQAQLHAVQGGPTTDTFTVTASNGTYTSAAGTVSVPIASPPSDTVIATIPVGSGPGFIAEAPDGSHVYVANNGGNTVSVIDTATNTVTATIPVGSAPQGVAVSPDGSLVYVVNAGGNTRVGDQHRHQHRHRDHRRRQLHLPVPGGGQPRTAACAYVTGNGGTVSINTATNTVTATNLDRHRRGGRVQPRRQPRLRHRSTPVSVPASSCRWSTPPPTPRSPRSRRSTSPTGSRSAPNGSRVYVTNDGDGTVSVIDTATNTVTATIPVGDQPGRAGGQPRRRPRLRHQRRQQHGVGDRHRHQHRHRHHSRRHDSVRGGGQLQRYLLYVTSLADNTVSVIYVGD